MSERAFVFGSWSGDLDDEYGEVARVVYHALADIAPRGWIPSGPDDPLLMRAFERWSG